MFNQHVVYIAGGFIPSSWANSIQQMKMAQSLARQARRFDLIFGVGPRVWTGFRPSRLRAWYGLTTVFPMHRRLLYPRWFGPTMEGAPRPQAEHARALAKYVVEQLEPDLVMTRWGDAADYCLERGIPTVYEQHEALDVRGQHVADHLALYQGEHFRALVTIHDLIAQTYIAAGLPPDKVLVLHDGADPDAFTPPLSTSEARAQLGLDVAGPLALYAGAVREERGAGVMLDAAARLPGWTFLLLGAREDDFAAWTPQITARGLDNVRLHGFVPNAQIPPYLQAADALLLPYTDRIRTHQWMSPLKLFEYMAAARPIVASDLPVIHEVLGEENALLIPPDDGAALAGALQQVADAPDVVSALAVQARADVTRYSWDVRAGTILGHALR